MGERPDREREPAGGGAARRGHRSLVAAAARQASPAPAPSPRALRPLQLVASLPPRAPMAVAGQLCLLYLSAGLLARLGAAFNLDTREDNVIRKSGDPGSLFGFSLAMHWQLQPEDKRL